MMKRFYFVCFVLETDHIFGFKTLQHSVLGTGQDNNQPSPVAVPSPAHPYIPADQTLGCRQNFLLDFSHLV